MQAMQRKMVEPSWLFVWLIAGFPSIAYLYYWRLKRKSRQDYSYFLELREFPLRRIFSLKVAASTLIGLTAILARAPFPVVTTMLLVFEVCAILTEGALLIGRPHPTPRYLPSRTACENCRAHEDDDCTNLRMLDGFEKAFRSKEGLLRPVCCCGLRIRTWRELLA